jgi:hypothetical protein
MTGGMQLDPPLQRVTQFTPAGFFGVRVDPEARETWNAPEDAAILDALVRRLAHGLFDVWGGGEHGGLLVAYNG